MCRCSNIDESNQARVKIIKAYLLYRTISFPMSIFCWDVLKKYNELLIGLLLVFLDSWISTEFGCIAKSIFFPPRIKIKIQRLKPWDQHFPERHGNWKQLKGEHLCGSTVSRVHLLANFSRVHSRGLAQHYFTVYMMGKNFLMIFLVPSYLPNDKKAQTSYLPSLEHMTSPKRHVLCLPVIL